MWTGVLSQALEYLHVDAEAGTDRGDTDSSTVPLNRWSEDATWPPLVSPGLRWRGSKWSKALGGRHEENGKDSDLIQGAKICTETSPCSRKIVVGVHVLSCPDPSTKNNNSVLLMVNDHSALVMVNDHSALVMVNDHSALVMVNDRSALLMVDDRNALLMALDENESKPSSSPEEEMEEDHSRQSNGRDFVEHVMSEDIPTLFRREPRSRTVPAILSSIKEIAKVRNWGCQDFTNE
ncbi:hypothetical protein HHK36_025675 [Tetracentron sinense]|uniref:Uncharacterized protein n=1 Tax=Tetracentron sinense TaxID=13715 RepID=A0A834YKW9_TETSI|nr:hypothetical protein HHK36_025675 [Tetracentron sinense]